MDIFEKKYNEALERARELIAKWTGKNKDFYVEDYAYIFPELRESDDERIRKDILRFLKAKIENCTSPTPAKSTLSMWIDYLEKQKEQKPDIELIQRTWYMEGYQDREHNREPEWIVKTGEGGPRYEENPKSGQPLPLAEEQKSTEIDEIIRKARSEGRQEVIDNPEYYQLLKIEEMPKTAWSEEDEKKIIFLERLIKYNVPEGQYGYKDGAITKLEAIEMLKSLRPQQKAEWSEEDKEMFQFAIRCSTLCRQLAINHQMEGLGGETTVKAYENLRNWLSCRFETLCCQPKVEWSEEDENNLNKLLQWDGIPLGLRSWVSGLPEKLGTCPSWKPSEEQMNCLCAAVDAAIRKHNESVSGYEPARVLKSLYEDLQKIR